MKDEIIRVRIVDRYTKAGRSGRRAVVGGLVAGGLGAVAGAASARDKDMVTFEIEYSSGKVEYMDCQVGDAVYQRCKTMQHRLRNGLSAETKAEQTLQVIVGVLLVVTVVAIALAFICA